jgi:PAS domain S-box-containing protein
MKKKTKEQLSKARLEALREVGLVLTAQLDLDTLLHSIVWRAIELLEGVSGGLYLYRPAQDVLEWTVAMGDNLPPVRTILRRGEGLSGKVLESGQPLIVDDYRHWEGRAAIYEDYPWLSVIAVPVRWSDEFLGVLDVLADTPHAFAPADAELLSMFATQAAIAIRNARLYEEERKRATQLAVVNQVARQAASTLDPDQLLQRIVTDIQQGFGYYNVDLYLMSETADHLERQAMLGGFAGIARPEHRQPLGVGVIGWSAQTGQPLLVNDVSQEPHYIPGCLEGALTKSELCVPLKLGERTIGVLDVQETRLNAFDDTDLLAMETLADQIAVTIENARLYKALQQELAERVRAESQRDATLEALQRRNRELELLNRTAQAFSASLDLDHVLVTVLGEVRRLLGVVACSAWLIDPGTGELVCRQVTDSLSELVRGWRLPPGQGIVGWVAQHGKSLNVPDTRADERHFKGVDSKTGLEIRSILSVPLRVKQRVIGAILVGDEKANRFDTTDVRLLESLASAAAIAVENARLYADLRASQEYARNLIDSSLDTIIAVDKGRRVVEFNKAAQATFGYHPDEILGQHIDILYVDPLEGLEIHRTTVEQGQCTREVLNKRKNGQVFPIFLSASVLRDAQGELVGVMGISRDITQRKQAEEQLRASLREKEMLLKEIHHRVKNNLQLISSLLDLQSDSIQDPQALAIFKDSQNRVRSMALIHQQLYQSSNLAQIDYVEHIRELAGRLFHSYGVALDAIKLDVYVEDPFMGVDIAIPCSLIINELFSNALKYAFPPQVERAARQDGVRIEITRHGDQMVLLVSDNGVGLPIGFDFRDTETLGLQLVRMLTQQVGGTIELDRTGGTTFKIMFPFQR